MIAVRRHGQGEWANWSENLSGWVEDQITFDAGVRPVDGRAWFREAGQLWQDLLEESAVSGRDLRPVGAGWSFSDILAAKHRLVSTAGLDAMYRVPEAWLEDRENTLGDRLSTDLVLVGGGVTVKRLNDWLQSEGLSLSTSGASNGQTIAGAIATGTHGSVYGLGGLQSQIAGIHLIGGKDRSYWIEHPDRPAASAALAGAVGAELRRDSDEFDAATVHLGGMGVVNAVLLRVESLFTMEVVQQKRVLSPDILRLLQDGDFEDFAREIYPDPEGNLYFLQVILNPFAPFTSPALIRLLFRLRGLIDLPIPPVRIPFEPLDLIGRITRAHPRARGPVIAAMMATLYPTEPRAGDRPKKQNWGGAMGDPVHDGLGQLYTGAVAVERSRLLEALQVMLPAFQRNNGGDLVFTLRFVREQVGLLSFQRFPPFTGPTDAVVIDMDGMNTPASHMAASRVFESLRSSQIPFHYHWGKMNEIDSSKVASDYAGPLQVWKQVRARLLDQRLHSVFGGTGLRDWGMI